MELGTGTTFQCYTTLRKAEKEMLHFSQLRLISSARQLSRRIAEGSFLIATSSFVDLNIMSSAMQTMQYQNAVALSQYNQASQPSQSRKRLHYYMGMTESISAATVMQLIKRNKMHDEYKRLLRNPENCYPIFRLAID